MAPTQQTALLTVSEGVKSDAGKTYVKPKRQLLPDICMKHLCSRVLYSLLKIRLQQILQSNPRICVSRPRKSHRGAEIASG